MPGGDSTPLAFLVVDGHSMVFAWPELRDLHHRSRAAARDTLARRLTTLQDVTGERVVLVFDGAVRGRAGPSPAGASPEDIQIIYSPQESTADAVIERLAGKYAAGRAITVASRDRGVLDTCSALGATAISARALLERVEGAEAELRRRTG